MMTKDTIILTCLGAVILFLMTYMTGHKAGVADGVTSCGKDATMKVVDGSKVYCMYTFGSSYGQQLIKERVR